MPDFLNIYNVLVVTALLSTILYIIKLVVFVFVGGDAEVSADFDSMTETETSFGFLSVQSILAFFMGFGWAGLAAFTQFELGGKLSIAIGLAAGLVFMFMSAYLMFCVKKLNKTVKVDYNELEGKPARTYTAFKPRGEGKIEAELNKKLTVLDAVSDCDFEIKSFEIVKVVKNKNNILHIIKE